MPVRFRSIIAVSMAGALSRASPTLTYRRRQNAVSLEELGALMTILTSCYSIRQWQGWDEWALTLPLIRLKRDPCTCVPKSSSGLLLPASKPPRSDQQ